jgi:hypothetical protein
MAETAAMATAAETTSRRASPARGPDGVTVTLLTVAGFLVILALLAWQMRSAPTHPARRVIVMRRIYETRVVETIVGGSRRGGSSITQSVSSSAPTSSLSTSPVTRSS